MDAESEREHLGLDVMALFRWLSSRFRGFRLADWVRQLFLAFEDTPDSRARLAAWATESDMMVGHYRRFLANFRRTIVSPHASEVLARLSDFPSTADRSPADNLREIMLYRIASEWFRHLAAGANETQQSQYNAIAELVLPLAVKANVPVSWVYQTSRSNLTLMVPLVRKLSEQPEADAIRGVFDVAVSFSYRRFRRWLRQPKMETIAFTVIQSDEASPHLTLVAQMTKSQLLDLQRLGRDSLKWREIGSDTGLVWEDPDAPQSSLPGVLED